MATVTVNSVVKVDEINVRLTLKVDLPIQSFITIEEDPTPNLPYSRREVYSRFYGRGQGIIIEPENLDGTRINFKNDYQYTITLTEYGSNKTTVLHYYVHLLKTPIIKNVFNGNNVARIQFDAVDGSNVFLDFSGSGEKDFFINLVGETYSDDNILLAEKNEEMENTYNIYLPNKTGDLKTYQTRASFANDAQFSNSSEAFFLQPTNLYNSVNATIEVCDIAGTKLPVVDGVIPNTTPTGFRIEWDVPLNGDMFPGDIYYFIYETDASGVYHPVANALTTLAFPVQKSIRTGTPENFVPGKVYSFVVLAHKENVLDEFELFKIKNDLLPNSTITAQFYGLPTIFVQDESFYNVEGTNEFYWKIEPDFKSYDVSGSPVEISYEGQPVEVSPFIHAFYENNGTVTDNKLLGRKIVLDTSRATVTVTYPMRRNKYALKFDDATADRSEGYSNNPTPTSEIVTMRYQLQLAARSLPSTTSSTTNVIYDSESSNATTYGYVQLNETKTLIKTNWTVDPLWSTNSKMYLHADVHFYSGETDSILLPSKIAGSTVDATHRTSDFDYIVPNTYNYYVRSYYKNKERLVLTTDSPSQTIYVPKMIEKAVVETRRTDISGVVSNFTGTTRQTVSIYITPPEITSYPYNNQLEYKINWRVYDGIGLGRDQSIAGLTPKAANNITVPLSSSPIQVDIGTVGIDLFNNDYLVYSVSNAYHEGKQFVAFIDQKSTVNKLFELLPPISNMTAEQVYGTLGLQDTVRFTWKSQITTKPNYRFYGIAQGESAFYELETRRISPTTGTLDPTTNVSELQTKTYSHDVALSYFLANKMTDFYISPDENNNPNDDWSVLKLKVASFVVQPYEILYLRLNHYNSVNDINSVNDMRSNDDYSKLPDPEHGNGVKPPTTNDDGTRTYYSQGDYYRDMSKSMTVGQFPNELAFNNFHYSKITFGESQTVSVRIDPGALNYLERGTITTNPNNYMVPLEGSIDVRGKFILPDYVHIYLTKPVLDANGTYVDTKEMFDVSGGSHSPSIVGADDLEIPGIVKRNGGQDIYIKIVNNAVINFKYKNLVNGEEYKHYAITSSVIRGVFIDSNIFDSDQNTVDGLNPRASQTFMQYGSAHGTKTERTNPFKIVPYRKTNPDLPYFRAINTVTYGLTYTSTDSAFAFTGQMTENYGSQKFYLKLKYVDASGGELRSQVPYVAPYDSRYPNVYSYANLLDNSDRTNLRNNQGETVTKSEISKFLSKAFDVYAMTYAGNPASFDDTAALQIVLTFPAQITNFSAFQADQSPVVTLSWTDNFLPSSIRSPNYMNFDGDKLNFTILKRDPSNNMSYVSKFEWNLNGADIVSKEVPAPNKKGTHTYYLCWNQTTTVAEETNLDKYNFIVEKDIVIVQNYQSVSNAYPTAIIKSDLAVVGNAVPYYFSANWTPPLVPTNTIVKGGSESPNDSPADILVYDPSNASNKLTIPLATYDVSSINLNYEKLDIMTPEKFNLLKELMKVDNVQVDYRMNFYYPDESNTTNLGKIDFKTKLNSLMRSTGVVASLHTGNLKVDYTVPTYVGYDFSALNLVPNVAIEVSGHSGINGKLVTYTDISSGYVEFIKTIDTENLLQGLSTPNVIVSATPNSLLVLKASYGEHSVATKAEPVIETEIYQTITPTDTSGVEIVYNLDQITNLTFVTPPTSVARLQNSSANYVKAYIVDFYTEGVESTFSLGYKLATSTTDASSSVIKPWKGLQSGTNFVRAVISAATVSNTSNGNNYSYLNYDDKELVPPTQYPSSYMEFANLAIVVPQNQSIDNGTPSMTFAFDQFDVAWAGSPVTFDGNYYLKVRDGSDNVQFEASYTPSKTITTPCAGKFNSGLYSGWKYEVAHSAATPSYYTRNGTLAPFTVPSTETIESTTLDISHNTYIEPGAGLIVFKQDDAVVSNVRCVDDFIPPALTQVDYRIDFYSTSGLYQSGSQLMYQIDTAKVHSVPSNAPPLKRGMTHSWNYTVQRKNSNGSDLGPAFTTTTPKTFAIQHSQSLDEIIVNLRHELDVLSFTGIVAPLSFHGKRLEVVYAGHVLLVVDSSNNVVNTSNGWLPSGSHTLVYNVYSGATLLTSGTCQPVTVLLQDTIKASHVDIVVSTVESFIHSNHIDLSGIVHLINDLVDVSNSTLSSTDYQISFKLTNEAGNGTFYEGTPTTTVVLRYQNVAGVGSTEMLMPDGTLSPYQNGFSVGHFKLSALFEHLNAAGIAFGDTFSTFVEFDIANTQRIADTTVELTHGGDKITNVVVTTPNSFVGKLIDVYLPDGTTSLLTIDSEATIVPNTHGVLSAKHYTGDDKLAFDITSSAGNATASPLKVTPFYVLSANTIDGAVVEFVVRRVASPAIFTSTEPDTILDSSNNYTIQLTSDVIDVSSNIRFGENVSTAYKIDFKDSSGNLMFEYKYTPTGVVSQKMWDGVSLQSDITLTTMQDILGVGNYNWKASIQRTGYTVVFDGATPTLEPITVNVKVEKDVPQFHIEQSQLLTDTKVEVVHYNDAIRSVVITAPRRFKETTGILIKSTESLQPIYVAIRTTVDSEGVLAFNSVLPVVNTSEGKLNSGLSQRLNVDFNNLNNNTIYTIYDKTTQLQTEPFNVSASETIEAAAGISLVYAYDNFYELNFTTQPKTPHGYTVLLTNKHNTNISYTYRSIDSSFRAGAISIPPMNLYFSDTDGFTFVITRILTPAGRTITGDVSVQLYETLTTFQQEIGVVAVIRVPASDGLDALRNLTVTADGFSQVYDISNVGVMLDGSNNDNTYDVSYSIVRPYIDNGKLSNPDILTNFSSLQGTTSDKISNNIISMAVYIATPLNNYQSKNFTLTLSTSHGTIASKVVTVTTGYLTEPVLLGIDYRDFQTLKTVYDPPPATVTELVNKVQLVVKKDGVLVSTEQYSDLDKGAPDVNGNLALSQDYALALRTSTASRTLTETGEYTFEFISTPAHQYLNYGTVIQGGTFHIASDIDIINIDISQNLIDPSCSVIVKVQSNGAKVDVITTPAYPSPYPGKDAVNIYVVAIATPQILVEYDSNAQALANAQLSGSVKFAPCYKGDDGFYYASLKFAYKPVNVLAIAASDIGVAIETLTEDGVQEDLGGAYFTGKKPFLARFE